MNEFMLIIKAIGNPVGSLPQEQQEQHIQKVGGFIQSLVAKGKMKDAQPLLPGGVIISNKNGDFSEQTLNEKEEMITGYYIIHAEDLNEATEIAKSDPRFEDGNWRMEIRQIMKIDSINS